MYIYLCIERESLWDDYVYVYIYTYIYKCIHIYVCIKRAYEMTMYNIHIKPIISISFN